MIATPLFSPESLLIPRHPVESCHLSQVELLTLEEDDDERARVAQLLRWGSATPDSGKKLTRTN
ncbi:hypothetical protein ACFST9_14500 [Hymenobacter monticola]|uniref:Uncharacterized protein n=1 Tax=Hymenobacter monticola TaxID=1705399 RepID=A0ABY4BC11_9BACT|nr:hypothetical protein [Hymenobacter monticola]UOE36678.1 hypothetical protein MTP16_25200 [Hymenobacter monticola]